MCRTPARSAAPTICFGFRHGHGQRLLAQHVPAAVGRRDDQVAVEAVRRRDDHGVHRRVLQQRKRVGVRARDAGCGRGLGQRRRVGVAERDDFGITAEPDARDVVGDGNLAGADEGDLIDILADSDELRTTSYGLRAELGSYGLRDTSCASTASTSSRVGHRRLRAGAGDRERARRRMQSVSHRRGRRARPARRRARR